MSFGVIKNRLLLLIIFIKNYFRRFGFSRSISSNRTVLKIVVKTKDEIEFTRSWIEHHAKIVGLENLIIADNLSTNPQIYEIYQHYGERLNWFQFEGHYDLIHSRAHFPDLYAALKKSTRYVVFLDMDERLVLFNEMGWIADARILEELSTKECSIISSPWLQNVSFSTQTFYFNSGKLSWGIKYGKPILSTKNPFWGYKGMHSVQYPKKDMEVLSFFTLHLSHYSEDQRLRSNKNKLVSNGVVKENDSYEKISEINISDDIPSPLTTIRCVEEIRMILCGRLGQGDESKASHRDSFIELNNDGTIGFSDKSTLKLFENYLVNERNFLELTLPTSPEHISYPGRLLKRN